MLSTQFNTCINLLAQEPPHTNHLPRVFLQTRQFYYCQTSLQHFASFPDCPCDALNIGLCHICSTRASAKCSLNGKYIRCWQIWSIENTHPCFFLFCLTPFIIMQSSIPASEQSQWDQRELDILSWVTQHNSDSTHHLFSSRAWKPQMKDY